MKRNSSTITPRMKGLCLALPATVAMLASPAFAADAGGSTMEFYGFAMLDMGYQSKQNDPAWFDVLRVTKLPSFENQYGVDGNWYSSVRDLVVCEGTAGELTNTRRQLTSTRVQAAKPPANRLAARAPSPTTERWSNRRQISYLLK